MKKITSISFGGAGLNYVYYAGVIQKLIKEDLLSKDMPLIQATKSLIGHGLGAAGGLESVACALQIKNNFIHKTINCEDLHPEIEKYKNSINYETKENVDVNIIAKSSFGFGDVNGCLIFKKYTGD